MTVLGESVDEPDQTFALALSNVTSGSLGTPAVQTVTIQDDDPTAVVTLDNPTVIEGNTGTTNVAFTATLDRQTEWNPSVSFVTADGTAVSGSDYYGTNGTRVFVAGATSLPGWVNVGVVADRVSEGTETFSLALSNPVNLVIGTGGTATVTDDDGAGLSVEDASTREGQAAQVKIRLTPPVTSAVDVDWATVSGTATADVDYVTSSGTAHFGVGQSEAVVFVATTLDSLVERELDFDLRVADERPDGDGDAPDAELPGGRGLHRGGDGGLQPGREDGHPVVAPDQRDAAGVADERGGADEQLWDDAGGGHGPELAGGRDGGLQPGWEAGHPVAQRDVREVRGVADGRSDEDQGDVPGAGDAVGPELARDVVAGHGRGREDGPGVAAPGVAPCGDLVHGRDLPSERDVHDAGRGRDDDVGSGGPEVGGTS